MTEFRFGIRNSQPLLRVSISSIDDPTRHCLAVALVDTGATHTSLANRVINQLSLQPLAPQPGGNYTKGIGGDVATQEYMCGLRLHSTFDQREDFGSERTLEIKAHDALGDYDDDVDVLVGMNALMQYRLVQLNGRTFTIDDATRLLLS